MAYLDELVAAEEQEPADDLIGRQLKAGTIEHGDLVSLALLLLIAGHETTANMISLGTLALLENPGRGRRRSADDPARRRAPWRNCCGTSPSPTWHCSGSRWPTSRSAAS